MLTRDLGGAELRTLEPWQAPAFAAYVARHREHLIDWLPWAETIVDDATAHTFLQRYADGTARDGQRIYAIWAVGEMVGGSLFRIFDTASSMCEIGVWLAPEAQGRGLVTRAVQAMIAWAIDVRGIRRIEWHCTTDNLASRTVAQRLGFTLEGVSRQSFEHRGAVHDVEIWSLLAGDRSDAR